MYLDYYIKDIEKVCKKHKVKFLFAFGSVLTKNFNEESDIDLVVEIKSTDPIEYAENYFGLKFMLEDLLKRPVDLLEQKALKNPYFIKCINKSKKTIYAA